MARVAVVAAAALVFLGACSASVTTTKRLDTGSAEDLIRRSIDAELGAPVGEVSCPEREVKQGDVFECTAQVGTQLLRLKVTQDDAEGNVSIKQAQAVIDVEQGVPLIEEQVRKVNGSSMKADCGAERFLVKDPGTTFDCLLTRASGRAGGRVIVTVKDVEGNLDLRLE